MIDVTDFAACCSSLTKLGVDYHLVEEWETNSEGQRVSVKRKKFQNVKLPFTPEEWVSLVSKDGHFYIGGCCGSSSATQDIICDLFRFESGWVGRNLARIAEQVIVHDGDTSLFDEFPNLSEIIDDASVLGPGEVRDPWVFMAVVWHLTKHHMSTVEVPHSSGDHIPPIRKALRILERVSSAIGWEHLFEKGTLEGPDSQRRAARSLALARLVPALSFVLERVDQLDLGEVNGFALIDHELGPNAIAKNGWGLCIYESLEEIEKLLAAYKDQNKDQKRFSTRPVRVNRREGLVFTDTNEVYDFVHKTPASDKPT